MTWLDIIAWSGYGGLTLFLALTRDTLALLTLHLRICHKLASRLVRWQMSSLGGLWNLFRGMSNDETLAKVLILMVSGKKWNVLRQRTDSYAYDVDQLFLGTLLFTVSAFLLPTVLTYAALFASVSCYRSSS
jgi:phosphatidylinositol glycan class Q protein